MMHLGHIEIFVSRPLEARVFYETVLGFALTVVQGDHAVWLKSGAVEILLRTGQPSPRAANYQSASMALVLYTDNLDAARQALEAHGVTIKGTDGSDHCLTFTDPDGNWFQLANPNEH